MPELNWTNIDSESSILSTDLNSLADGSAAISADQNNEDGDIYGRWELSLASIDLSAQTNPVCNLYYIKSIDGGSSYEDGGASVEPARRPDVIFPLRGVNGAQVVIMDIEIPTGHYKALLCNETGTALASSGNKLALAEFSQESN